MTTDTKKHYSTIRLPFADGDYDFALPYDRVNEYEEKHGSLYVSLHRLLQFRDLPRLQLRELVRLALIGAGMSPMDALVRVKRYVDDRPSMENVELAGQIMEAALFGSPEWQLSPEGIASKERTEKLRLVAEKMRIGLAS